MLTSQADDNQSTTRVNSPMALSLAANRDRPFDYERAQTTIENATQKIRSSYYVIRKSF